MITSTSATTAELLELLLRDRPALSRRQVEADRVIAASGAGHLVHEMNVRPGEAGGRPWRIDPIPVVIDGAKPSGNGISSLPQPAGTGHAADAGFAGAGEQEADE